MQLFFLFEEYCSIHNLFYELFSPFIKIRMNLIIFKYISLFNWQIQFKQMLSPIIHCILLAGQVEELTKPRLLSEKI